MTVEKTVIAKFECSDGITREFELKPDGEVVIREYDGAYNAHISGLTLKQLEQALTLFQKEAA